MTTSEEIPKQLVTSQMQRQSTLRSHLKCDVGQKSFEVYMNILNLEKILLRGNEYLGCNAKY